MRKIILIVVLLAGLAVVVHADMVDTTMVDRWSLVNSNTIMLYQGSEAVALVKLMPGTLVTQMSEILFVDDTVEDGGYIIIDGEREDILSVERLD